MDGDALIKPIKCGDKGDVVGLGQVSIPNPVKEETVDEAKASGLENPTPFSDLPPAVGRILVKMVEGFIWASSGSRRP